MQSTNFVIARNDMLRWQAGNGCACDSARLVETAFLWKGTEKQESVKNEVRMWDRLHVRGGGMRREGDVQEKQDFEIPRVGFE